MTTTVAGVRTVTELDLARLLRLGLAGPHGELQDGLADMDVVPSTDVPGDVVTMHSRVRIVHVDAQRQQELTLAYPQEAHPASGLISVLSPVGRAFAADLVVVGRRPQSALADVVAGSVAHHLLACASSDVLVVPARADAVHDLKDHAPAPSVSSWLLR